MRTNYLSSVSAIITNSSTTIFNVMDNFTNFKETINQILMSIPNNEYTWEDLFEVAESFYVNDIKYFFELVVDDFQFDSNISLQPIFKPVSQYFKKDFKNLTIEDFMQFPNDSMNELLLKNKGSLEEFLYDIDDHNLVYRIDYKVSIKNSEKVLFQSLHKELSKSIVPSLESF